MTILQEVNSEKEDGAHNTFFFPGWNGCHDVMKQYRMQNMNESGDNISYCCNTAAKELCKVQVGIILSEFH